MGEGNERKRVVGRWCEAWDVKTENSKCLIKVVDYNIDGYYWSKLGEMPFTEPYRFAEPLTDEQLKALGLENN